MSKKDLINAIEVKSPCAESWDEMHGNDKVRFCSHCAKDVNNLSEMTRKEALRLVRRSEGRLCVRYIQHPVTNKPLFSENLYKITRRATGLAAGVMTASISLSTAAYAQGGVRPPLSGTDAEQTASLSRERAQKAPAIVKTASITGVVTDQNGAVIPAIPVSLIDEKTNESFNTVSNEEGRYEFRNVGVGKYTLEFKGVAGFQSKQVPGVTVTNDDPVTQNITLDTMPNMTVGGLTLVEQPPLRHAISMAVENEDLGEVQDLITRHADVNAKEKSRGGITPLFVAVENGNLEIAELLLRFGARVNVRDANRQTPLMKIDDDASPALVDLLVKYGARVNLLDNEGNTALILAANYGTDVAVIQALTDAGADIDHQNNEGETALMKAANNDDLELVRALVLAGANVMLKNNEGDTAWDLTGDADVEQLLESYGGASGNPEEPDSDEPTQDQPGLPDQN